MNIYRIRKLFSLVKGLVKSDFQTASNIMGEMHGFPQKVGQHLTLYPGNGNDQYFESLYSTSKTETISLEKILAELNLPYNKAEIRAQASIGQVYKIETDSQMLALKVKYPEIEKKINGDFKLLKVILWPTKFSPLRNSSLLSVLEQMRKMLLNECDYNNEAMIQMRFHQLFDSEGDICVPAIGAYNGHAITSQWVDGKDLTFYRGILDKRFVQAYLKFILKSLKHLGMVHADPHPGNFIISGNDEDFQLSVIDFGAVVSFDSHEIQAVSRLFLGEYNDEPELIEDLKTLGVSTEVLMVYEPIIGDLVSILMEPFYYPNEYNFASWRLQYKLNTLLASRSWEKPLDIPLKILLLFRTLQGLYFYARTNFVAFNWHASVRDYLH